MFGKTNVVRHVPPHGEAHGALQRTGFSFGRKAGLGLLAMTPFLVMVLTIVTAIVPSVIADLISRPVADFVEGYGWWVAGFLVWAVAIYFALLVVRSEFTIVEKRIWCAGLLMFPIIAVLAFWVIAIVREKTLAEIFPLPDLESAGRSGSPDDQSK